MISHFKFLNHSFVLHFKEVRHHISRTGNLYLACCGTLFAVMNYYLVPEFFWDG